MWNPKIFIENTIGEAKETAFQMLKYHEDGQAIIEEKRRFSGTYLENLELKDFPFDVQVGFICTVLQPLVVCFLFYLTLRFSIS